MTDLTVVEALIDPVCASSTPRRDPHQVSSRSLITGYLGILAFVVILAPIVALIYFILHPGSLVSQVVVLSPSQIGLVGRRHRTQHRHRTLVRRLPQPCHASSASGSRKRPAFTSSRRGEELDQWTGVLDENGRPGLTKYFNITMQSYSSRELGSD